MAKLYQPTQQSPQQSGADAFQGTTDSTDTTTLGVPKSSLQNLFFTMGASNPKSISSLTQLLGLVTPSATEAKAQQTAQEKQKAIAKGNKTIDTIYSYWKSGVANSPLSRIGSIAAVTTGKGALNPAQARISAEFFANLEPELRKAAVSGRITQQEIQWLRSNLLPNGWDTQQSAQEKINALKSAFGEYTKDNGDTSAIPANTNIPGL